jgi:O-antigen ligase
MFVAYVGVGALAVSIVKPQVIVILLLAPVVLLLAYLALRQGIDKLRNLSKHLVWWHILWLLLCLSALVFRIRDIKSIRDEPVDIWAAYRILLVAITAGVLFVIQSLRRSDWIRPMFRGVVGALGAYSLISAISTAWSIYPSWTLYKSFEYAVDVALLAATLVIVSSVEAYKTVLDWMWVLLAGLLGTVWFEAALWPDKAFVPSDGIIGVRLAGFVPAVDQDTVGEWAAILAIVALSRLLAQSRNRQVFYWVVLVGSLFTLLLTQARTALVGFLLGSILVLLFSKRLRVIGVLILALGLLVCITRFGNLAQQFWERGDSEQTRQGFTGRLPEWEYGWGMFLKHPITGYGAYAGGRFAAVAAAVDDPLRSNSLNDYMEIVLGTGLCGLIPIVFVLVATWRRLIRSSVSIGVPRQSRRLAIEAMGVFAIMTTESFFSTELIWHPAQVFLVVVGLTEVLRRERLAALAMSNSPYRLDISSWPPSRSSTPHTP